MLFVVWFNGGKLCTKINLIFKKLKQKTMEQIKKLENQIKALNKRLQEGKVKNVYSIQNKIKSLKNKLKIEIDNHHWETYLSN
jgi:sugar-specific transcriptional regulator TrmB